MLGESINILKNQNIFFYTDHLWRKKPIIFNLEIFEIYPLSLQDLTYFVDFRHFDKGDKFCNFMFAFM